MRYFTQYIPKNFFEMGHSPSPDPTTAGQVDIPFSDTTHSAPMVPQLRSFGVASMLSATWSWHLQWLKHGRRHRHVWRGQCPPQFTACIPQGVQQNSNLTSLSDISRPASQNSVSTYFQQKSIKLEVVIITPETL